MDCLQLAQLLDGQLRPVGSLTVLVLDGTAAGSGMLDALALGEIESVQLAEIVENGPHAIRGLETGRQGRRARQRTR